METRSVRLSRRSLLALCGTAVAAGTTASADGRDDTASSQVATTETTARLEVRTWTLPDEAVSTSLSDVDSTDVAGAVGEHVTGVFVRDVHVVGRDSPVLEVRTDTEPTPVADGLSDALGESVEPDALDPTPTGYTVGQTASVLERRLETALPAADAEVTTTDGTITVTAEGDVEETIREIATARRLQLLAHAPSEGDRVRSTRLFWGDDVTSTDPPTAPQQAERAYVDVTLSEVRAEIAADQLQRLGFTDEGVDSCGGELEPQQDEYCLLAVVDGEDRSSFGLRAGPASAVEDGSFVDDRELRLYADSLGDAELIRHSLLADSLPAPLAVSSIEVSDGQEPASPAGAPTNDSADQSGPADDDSTDSLPGPGVVGSLAGLALGSALAARRRDGDGR